MAEDLADRLDDLICAVDEVVTASDIDTFVLVFVGWFAFGGLVLAAIHFLLRSTPTPLAHNVPESSYPLSNHGPDSPKNEEVLKISSSGTEPIYSTIRKVASSPRPDPEVETQVPLRKISPTTAAQNGSAIRARPSSTSPRARPSKSKILRNSVPSSSPQIRFRKRTAVVPVSIGSDPECVAWVNHCFRAAFTQRKAVIMLLKTWKEALVDYNRKSGAMEGISVEFLDFSEYSDPPLLTSVTTHRSLEQNRGLNDMTVTAEVDACFALLLRVTREMKRTGDESSDHLLHLDSLVGRLNLQVYSEERFIVCKFDGWPQIRTHLTSPTRPTRSYSTHQSTSPTPPPTAEEQHLSEIVGDIASAAIRGARINVDMEEFADGGVFPVFTRRADGIGYDAIDEDESEVSLITDVPRAFSNNNIEVAAAKMASTLPRSAAQKVPSRGETSRERASILRPESLNDDDVEPPLPLPADVTSAESRRGRRKNKRNLLSTFKKKLVSASRRSLSLPDATEDDLDGGDEEDRARSVSSIRSAAGNLMCGYTSARSYRDDSSDRSEVSGASFASNRTYLVEESSLVLETTRVPCSMTEQGTLETTDAGSAGESRFFLIPNDVARKGRFRKKGTKLHVYLDHIFVAQHVKGGTLCGACEEAIPMRLGKQAYVCRDCGLVCHKPCHVRVAQHCAETSLPNMELECYDDSIIFIPRSPNS